MSTSRAAAAGLAGKRAMVTGAGRRVGREIALELARAGAHLAVHVGRSVEAGEETAREARALGVEAEVFQADQRSVAEVEAACDAAIERFGGLDILVNSAAIWPRTSLEDTAQEDFDQALEVNLRGPFFFARAIGLAMRDAGGGSIVNIADVSHDRPWTDSLAYCAAKAGLVSLTYGLAKALAPRVRVNAIGPGPVLFPEGFAANEQRSDVAATLVQRRGTPGDVARAVRYLCEADFVTGILLPVDGGYRFGI